MAIEFQTGRPNHYTRERHDKIIAAIRKNAPYEIAAWSARICGNTLTNWMTQGKNDKNAGIHSDYAQLLDDILDTEANKVMEHLTLIEAGHKTWQPRLKILERRWRKYFGQDASLYQELVDRALKIEEAFKRLHDLPMQGATSHGGEMDTESDQEARSTSEGTRGEEGRENTSEEA